MENLGEILAFVKDQIVDGSMTAPVSKQYNSTQASLTEMAPIFRANLIAPLQRIIKRKIEHEVYRPLLMSKGFSVRVTPVLSFEAPDARRDEEALYYSTLVNAGIMPPEVAAKELGFEEEFLKWKKEKEAREEEMFQAGKLNQPQQQNVEQGGKKWQVTEIG